MNLFKVTESDIGKAELNPQEAMVLRVFANLKSAGKEKSHTRRFVQKLSERKYQLILESAREKIEKFLSRAGN